MYEAHVKVSNKYVASEACGFGDDNLALIGTPSQLCPSWDLRHSGRLQPAPDGSVQSQWADKVWIWMW